MISASVINAMVDTPQQPHGTVYICSSLISLCAAWHSTWIDYAHQIQGILFFKDPEDDSLPKLHLTGVHQPVV